MFNTNLSVFSLLFYVVLFLSSWQVFAEYNANKNTECGYSDHTPWGDYSYLTLSDTGFIKPSNVCRDVQECDNTWGDKQRITVSVYSGEIYYIDSLDSGVRVKIEPDSGYMIDPDSEKIVDPTTVPSGIKFYWQFFEGHGISDEAMENVVTHILFHARHDTVVDVGQDDRIPLIVIHGWEPPKNTPLHKGETSSRCASVKKHYENLYDKEDSYFATLNTFLSRQYIKNKYRVYYYSYASYKHVTYNARMLSNLLSENEYISKWIQGNKKIAIIAHSMGGLIARSFLEEHQQQHDILAGLITLGTPHHGSPSAIKAWIDTAKVGDFLGDTDLLTPGAADLHWDNYDEIFFFVPKIEDMFFVGDRKRIDCKILSNRTDVKEKNWYGVGRENHLKPFDTLFPRSTTWFPIICFDDTGFTTTKYLSIKIPAYPNPWLSNLNENLTDEFRKKYFFYAGIHYYDNSHPANIVSDDDKIYSIGTKTLYGAGYLSDGIVPLTSGLFDIGTKAKDVLTTDHEKKMVGHTNLNLLGFLEDDNRYLFTSDNSSPKLRLFKDYHHSRITKGAYHSEQTDLLNVSVGSGFKEAKSRLNYIIQAYGHTIVDMHPRSNLKNCPISVQVNGIRWCDEDQYLTNWNLGSIYNKVDYEPLFIQINRDLNDIACVAKPEICSNVLDTPCQKSISDCHQFSDSTLSKNNWFYGDMELLKKWRAIAPENFFMPLQKVSRAEFTKMTLIAFGVAIANEPKPSVNPFNDVSKNDDYASYIAIAKNEGIVDGYSDGTFGPEHLITRAEAAKILINHAKAKSEIPSGVKLADYDNYRYLYSDFDEYLDGDNKSYWFVTEFLSTSRELGILEGQGQGGIQRKLALNEQISRAEAVKMISAAVCVSWLSRAVLERRDPLTGLHCVYAGRL